MAYILNTLDFDENGRATIEIPEIQQDYSFVLNHWQSPQIQLEEIKHDLSCPDSEERRVFLEKSQRLLSEYLGQYIFDDDDCDEVAEQAKIDGYADLTEAEIEEVKRLDGETKDWRLPSCLIEGEEEQEYNLKGSKANVSLETDCNSDFENPQYLIVYNFRLGHSLAWYLMNLIDDEIVLVEQQIEKEYGALKMVAAPNGVDEFLKLVRQSTTPFEANKAIMEHFQLSSPQANFIMEMKLNDVTAIQEKDITERIEFYNFIISLLRGMK